MAVRRRKPSPNASDALLLKLALKQIESAERHAKDVNDRKDRAQKVYLGRTNAEYGRPRNESDPRDWRSRLFPPVAFEHVELAISELASSPPEFAAHARLPEHEVVANAAEEAVGYYLDRARFARTYRTIIRHAVKYGDCPVKIMWRKETCTRTEQQQTGVDPDTGAAVFEDVDVDYTLCEGPAILPIHYTDWLPDPTAKILDDASWVYHKWRSTLADLEGVLDDDGKPLYRNLDQLSATPGSDPSDGKRKNETDESFEARTTGVHTLHERWTRNGVLVIANKQVVIRHDEDPNDPIFLERKIPFVVVRLIEDEDNLGGVALPLMIDQQQEAYWKFFNELVNAITLRVRPPKLVDEEADTNADLYDIFPEASIPARNGESTVKVLTDIASIDGFAMDRLLALVRDLIERTTGMNAQVAGFGSAASATEASQNLAQSKGRVKYMTDTADDDLSELAERVYQRIQQFADEAVVAKLTDGRSVRFDTDELVGQMMFSSSIASRAVLRDQRLNQLITIWEAIVPVLQPGTVEIERVDKLLRELFHTAQLDGLEPSSKTPEQAQLDQAEVQLHINQANMLQQQQFAPPLQPGAAGVPVS